MTSADEIATLARLRTTSHEDAVKLIEQYGEVMAAAALAENAAQAHERIVASMLSKESANA